jgi:hypothetical protein
MVRNYQYYLYIVRLKGTKDVWLVATTCYGTVWLATLLRRTFCPPRKSLFRGGGVDDEARCVPRPSNPVITRTVLASRYSKLDFLRSEYDGYQCSINHILFVSEFNPRIQFEREKLFVPAISVCIRPVFILTWHNECSWEKMYKLKSINVIQCIGGT